MTALSMESSSISAMTCSPNAVIEKSSGSSGRSDLP